MAVNLLGAMGGGLLEYNSMFFGFRALYLMAMGLYVVALVWELVTSGTHQRARAPLPAPAELP
jgi:hypothetical protein